MPPNSKGIRAGRAFVELGVDDRLAGALRAAERRLKAFGAGVTRIGAGLAAAGTAGLVPFAAAVRSFARTGDELDKMNRRTGVAVESLSELGFAAQQSGTDLGTVEKGLRRMTTTINDAGRGLSTANDALGAVGLQLEDLQGLSPEDQFLKIADGLNEIDDASTRAAVAQQIFGRAGTQLLPMLEGGAAGLEELRQQARDLGLVMSTVEARDAARLTDAMAIVGSVFRRTAVTVGAALAPAIERVAEVMAGLLTGVSGFVRRNQTLVIAVAAGAALAVGFGTALVALGASIALAGFALGGLASAVGVALSPIGLLVAAVAGLGVILGTQTRAIAAFSSAIQGAFARSAEVARTAIAGSVAALSTGEVELAAEIMTQSVVISFESARNSILDIWESITDSIAAQLISLQFDAQSVLASVGLAAVKTAAILASVSTDAARFNASFAGGVFAAAGNAVFGQDLSLGGARTSFAIGSSLASGAVNTIADPIDNQVAMIEAMAAAAEEGIQRGIGRELAARLAALGDLGEARDAETAERQRLLDEQIAKLNELRSRAGSSLSVEQETFDRLRRELGEALAGASEQIEARGTFSGDRLGDRFGVIRIERDQLRALQGIERTTERILDQARTGGAVFS